MHKLKNKLGTRQLPTAELNLSGTKAELIGAAGRGVKLISGWVYYLCASWYTLPGKEIPTFKPPNSKKFAHPEEWPI